MAGQQTERLHDYLDRVTALRDERTDALTQRDLQQIALELGLGHADIELAQAEAQRCLERGRQFLAHGRFDDAVTQLTEAVALAPDQLEPVFALAEAHAARFQARRSADDRREAERLARLAIDIEPGFGPAYELLNRLEGRSSAPAPAQPTTPIDKQRQRWILVGAFLFPLLLVGLLLGSLLVRPSPSAPAPVATAEPVVAQAESADVDVDSPADLPVELVGAKNLAFDARRSRLDVYSDSAFYRLWGAVTNEGDTVVETLRLRFELRNAAGETVASDAQEVLGDHEAALRPGDTHVFDFLKRVPAEVATVVVTEQTREEKAAAGRYDAAKPVPVSWAFAQPSHLSIAVGERESVVRKHGRDQVFHAPVFEVTNTGDAAIEGLKMEITRVDGSGRTIDAREFYIAASNIPPLEPGETRLQKVPTILDGPFEEYRLSVLEAE